MKAKLAGGRKRMGAGVLVLTLVVMAFTTAVALAANVSGDGTLVGSTGSDSIKAGSGNDTIYGRGGSDTISAGAGKDLIDAGGSCPPGLAAGDYPKGLPSGDYCQDGPFGTFGTVSIKAGDGSDTVYGNGGANNIVLGDGSDTVFAYGGPNSVKVGNGADTIYAFGTGNYNTGTGTDTVFAQFSSGDIIKCGSNHTTVYTVQGANSISNNCTVKFVPSAAVPDQRASVRILARTGRKVVTKRAT